MISIIIPLFNKEKTIRETILSVCNQSYTDWELLIVDDGSTDRSASIVNSYLNDKRVKYFCKPNGGVSSARNYGMQKAQGEWLLFLDADDTLLTNCLEILLATASKYDTSIVVGNHYIYKNGQSRMAITKGKDRVCVNFFKEFFFNKISPRTGSVMMKSEIAKQFPYDSKLKRFEDFQSLFDMMRNRNLAYTQTPVMIYNQDYLGLSKPCIDICKDFLAHLDFNNKSFWECVELGELLRIAFKSYPNQRLFLMKRYYKNLIYVLIAYFFLIFKKIKLKAF